MSFFKLKERRIFLLSFFILSLVSFSSLSFAHDDVKSVLERAENQRLDKDPTWRALLQQHPFSKSVSDPNFYLSLQRDPQSELQALIQALQIPEKRREITCRFPARTLWLKQRLSLADIDFSACDELNVFIKRAPADRVAVVFAAENISQPSSMMGHVFFKIEGNNEAGIPTEHMISFFTEIRDANPLTLIWESLITGKKSFYTLTPYEENKNFYLFNEHRSIWEYQLRLSSERRQLLHFYFFELKAISFSYFFHSFNCATLVRNMLAVAYPETAQATWFVSPLDVLRSLTGDAYVEDVKMIPATPWKLSVLATQLSPHEDEQKSLLRRDYGGLQKSSVPERNWLLLDLASTYNDSQLERGKIATPEWRENKAALQIAKEHWIVGGGATIEKKVNPALAQGDSNVFVGHMGNSRESRYIIGVLPAAHALGDDDRQYLNQWELKLGEFSVAHSSTKNSLMIHSAILYSAMSLAPSQRLLPRLSGLLRMGYEPKINDDLGIKNSLFVEGGLGKTYRLHPAIDWHFLVLAGGQSDLESTVYSGVQTGVRLLEVHGLQTSLKWNSDLREGARLVHKASLEQGLNSKFYSFALGYQYLLNGNAQQNGPVAQEDLFVLQAKYFF